MNYLDIYRASAGSGKTFTLVREYLRLLFANREHPLPHRLILAVTFTNRATAEMKERIMQALHELATGQPSPYRTDLLLYCNQSAKEVDHTAEKMLCALLRDYSAVQVSTIDSFFLQVVRSFARELGLPGSYSVRLKTDDVLHQAVDDLYYSLDDPKRKRLLDWLTEITLDNIDNQRSWNIRKDIEAQGRNIFTERFQRHRRELAGMGDRLRDVRTALRSIQTEYERGVNERAQAVVECMERHGLSHTDFTRSYTRRYSQLAEGKPDVKDGRLLSQSLRNMAEDVTHCYTKTSTRKADIEAAYANGLQAAMQAMMRFEAEETPHYLAARTALSTLNILGVISDLNDMVESISRDNNEMLLQNSGLLLHSFIGGSGDAPFVYEKVGVSLHHFMIDEFQDTSRMQWNNFRPLIDNSAAHGHRSMIVGDVKQSIYRWRNSDWSLLGGEVNRELRYAGPAAESLEVNFRSLKSIVDFNNAFFVRAAALLDGQLQAQGAEGTDVISEAYADCAQRLPRSTAEAAAPGYVQVEFIDSTNVEADRQEALRRTWLIVDDLRSRQIPLERVTVLTRTNTEACLVAEHLIAHGLKVVSSEGLRVGHATPIRFLTALLHMLVNPDDNINRTILHTAYFALQHTDDAAALRRAMDYRLGAWQAIFTDEEQAALNTIEHQSLYDLTESLIHIFHLGQQPADVPYVQTFQDLVFNYTAQGSADLKQFVDWWDTDGVKQCIPTPQLKDAVQIMTVHASKGLAFDVVVMPFANWSLTGQNDLIWIEPRTEPYSRLKLLPITYSSQLQYTDFAPEYAHETMQRYVDNLNIGYVAFTRTRKELYCIAARKTEGKGAQDGRMTTFAHLLEAGTSDLPEADGIRSLGRKGNADDYAFRRPQAAVEFCGSYDIHDIDGRLRPHSVADDYWLMQQPMDESRLKLGTVMHRLLSLINVKSDEAQAIARMVDEGQIAPDDVPEVRAQMDAFWQIEGVGRWFDGSWQVRTEASILTPDGSKYRPDRILFSPDRKQAVVVDWKFGQPSPAHHKQVARYAHLLRQMGYQAEAYLCYVAEQRILKVEN